MFPEYSENDMRFCNVNLYIIVIYKYVFIIIANRGTPCDMSWCHTLIWVSEKGQLKCLVLT